MASATVSSFRALIIGGSVAGLTLAHMFERAGIDYILLEARDTISPQLGASIVIMPNGARILDQMGLLDAMAGEGGFMAGMKKTMLRRDDGRMVGETDWPRLVEERLGYPCGICERRLFLASLYDQLKDKSKILLNKKLLSMRHSEGSVTAKCADGSEYTGSIIIGADGIHSRTRNEMHRIAPAGLVERDKKSITAEYACIFGISTPMPELTVGDSHTSSSLDHSSLLFVGRYGLPQWFFFFKLPQRYVGADNIPHFTKQQMEAEVEENGDYHFSETVTLKGLMATTTKVSFFPLEEANHEIWTYGRVVCLGDAIHKMTPNMGQGGNQAIESAAVLTNCLSETLYQNPSPSLGIITSALHKYQSLRQARAKWFVELSGSLTRVDALASLKQTLRFLYFPPLSGEVLAGIQIEMNQSAPFLDFLPLPKRADGNEIWRVGGEKVRRWDNIPFSRVRPKARI